MSLTYRIFELPDPDGHKPALLLKGDWLVVEIADGTHRGLGEASHSCDDVACRQRIGELFGQHCAHLRLTLESIRELERGPFSQAANFIEATAMSALNQALYDLLAKREVVPVWQLFTPTPVRESVSVYATINRALDDRSDDDYRATVEAALAQGFTAIKCAPFEAVTATGDQVAQSEQGFQRLAALRQVIAGAGIRVDCHERFRMDPLRELLPRFNAADLDWLEAPLPIGPDYAAVRKWTDLPIALGELFFGWPEFERIVSGNWADVIMPDVKHCGGFGPLLDICSHAPQSHQVSPHNPSGPVATAASLHAAAVCPAVTSLEMVLIKDPARAYYLNNLSAGQLQLPTGPGWGVGTIKSEGQGLNPISGG